MFISERFLKCDFFFFECPYIAGILAICGLYTTESTYSFINDVKPSVSISVIGILELMTLEKNSLYVFPLFSQPQSLVYLNK